LSISDEAVIKITGPTNIVGGVIINPNATFFASDGLVLITGNTTNNGFVHMIGADIIPQGGIVGNGRVKWEPRAYNKQLIPRGN
jgi:hypothetical protein